MSARILVVDDEPGIRDMFLRVVGGLGYHVVAVPSGEDALRRLGSQQFDVAFCDLMLNGMNGLSLMKALLRDRPGLPVAIMTGYPTADVEAGARRLGAFAFLSKPCQLREIEAAIAAALTRRRP